MKSARVLAILPGDLAVISVAGLRLVGIEVSGEILEEFVPAERAERLVACHNQEWPRERAAAFPYDASVARESN